MKTLILYTYLFFLFSNFSQTKIDNTKIELFCFKIHNTLRSDNDQRTLLVNCKKTADLQVDYISKSGIISHENPSSGNLKKRFSMFNFDTVVYKDIYEISGFGKANKYDVESEIITYLPNIQVKNDSTLYYQIASKIINNFINSEGHKKLMLSTGYSFKRQGYFSVRTKVISNVNNNLTLDVYCVAVFSTSFVYD